MAKREDERPQHIDYASPDAMGRFSKLAIAAFVCVTAAAMAIVLLDKRIPLLMWNPARLFLEILAYLGPPPAVILGFRAMVFLEKEENRRVRGVWLAAAGLFGGAAMVLAFFVKVTNR